MARSDMPDAKQTGPAKQARRDLAERSGRPYLQGRVRARWGAGDEAAEVGLGGHYGWLVNAAGERVESRALAFSLWVPLGPKVEVRAEGFTGQALAGLGGGGIDDHDDADLNVGSRLRNVSVEGHLLWRKAPVVLGLEVRGLRTRYAAPSGTLGATHFNLAAGFEF